MGVGRVPVADLRDEQRPRVQVGCAREPGRPIDEPRGMQPHLPCDPTDWPWVDSLGVRHGSRRRRIPQSVLRCQGGLETRRNAPARTGILRAASEFAVRHPAPEVPMRVLCDRRDRGHGSASGEAAARARRLRARPSAQAGRHRRAPRAARSRPGRRARRGFDRPRGARGRRVVVAFGPRSLEKDDVQETLARNLVLALRKHGVKRLREPLGLGAGDSAAKAGLLFAVIRNTVLRQVYRGQGTRRGDPARPEPRLVNVRPGRLLDSPARGA